MYIALVILSFDYANINKFIAISLIVRFFLSKNIFTDNNELRNTN